MPGLLGRSQEPRRPPDVRALHPARHQLDVAAAAQHAARWKRQRGSFPHFSPLSKPCSLNCLISPLFFPGPVLPTTQSHDRRRQAEVQL